jgi:hypothetical protein
MPDAGTRRPVVKYRILALAALAVALSACSSFALGSWDLVRGNGDVRLESRDVAPFTAIENAGSGLVRLMVGPVRQVTVEADANILPHVQTEVRGGVLVLRTEPGVSINPTRLVFRVTAPRLEAVTVAGSGDVRFEKTTLVGQRLAIAIDGSGDVEAAVEVEEVAVEIRGSGDVTLAGTATSARFEIYGSGAIDAERLPVADARAVIRGSGSVTLEAARSLDVDIAGSGDVRFRGNARVTVRDTGSGDLVEY